MKRWKCSVCGYVHTGDVPPEKCPLCGVAKEKFVEIAAEKLSRQEKVSGRVGQNFWIRQILKHHLHPMLVHFPNGLLPVSLLFLALVYLFGGTQLQYAAFFNLIAVLIVLPAVMFTGYVEWQSRYRGARTLLFKIKIAASITVLTSLVILVLWRFVNPEVMAVGSSQRHLYFALAAFMVAAVALAGHLGGTLVHRGRD
ncbi:rubredoxin-like domain-containing protein [Desulfotalea psychrophila]|nr:DUF2231 domain-containing protein [Desulfotalea psychrophila]